MDGDRLVETFVELADTLVDLLPVGFSTTDLQYSISW